jgi:acetyltransferase-like isoleucine patch superfamily enzyme
MRHWSIGGAVGTDPEGRPAQPLLPPNPYHPLAWIVGEPDIGSDVWIGAFTVIDGSGGLVVGHGCDISAGAQIYTHSTVARCLTDRGREIDRAATRIGRNVHIGANAVVLMGSDIGDYSAVGAGAVVLQGTVAPPHSLLVGVPARVIPDGARGYAATDE